MARYDLPAEDLAARGDELVGRVRAGAGEAAPVGVAWIAPDHALADVVRTLEARWFPDIAGFTSPDVEARCRFLVVVDLAEPASIAHVMRTSSRGRGPDPAPGTVGIPMADEVVEANEGITADDVVAHYRDRDVDLRRCQAVETNIRVSRSPAAPTGLRWSDHAYIAVFRDVMRGPEGERGVFAHLNAAAVRSLSAIGITHEPFAGQEGLRSPAAQEGTFDDRYAPAFIPSTPANVGVFRDLEALAAPEVRVGLDEG